MSRITPRVMCVTSIMGTKCKTGRQRQELRDAIREAKANGYAWVNRDGWRLKINPPFLPGEGQSVHALVREGNRVVQRIIVGKDAGDRLRVFETGRRGNPGLVLAVIEERHPIPGVVQKGGWSAKEKVDRYPGYPRTYPNGV